MRRLRSMFGLGGRVADTPPRRGRSGLRTLAIMTIVATVCASCAETITNHGHLFQENDLAQISPGMSAEQVRTSLGTPTTTATVGAGSAFYYISSVEAQSAFFAPKEKDRRVVAVYFSKLGGVDRVAQYGLKDGKVFDYVKNETPSLAKDEGILKALFRNLGVKQLGLE
jgi:outer membrane protein assembly factor BamE (lipoprotein component of BamABCDE complex)